MTLVSGNINHLYIIEGISCCSVVKPKRVAEIDEFAVFPLTYLRTFQK